MAVLQQSRIIKILAITQVLSWGSIYYALSVLSSDIQRELGWRAEIVRGTVPQALFGRDHYGAISGALAGPLAVAALLAAQPSVPVVLALLLALSLLSLACYVNAIGIKVSRKTPA